MAYCSFDWGYSLSPKLLHLISNILHHIIDISSILPHSILSSDNWISIHSVVTVCDTFPLIRHRRHFWSTLDITPCARRLLWRRGCTQRLLFCAWANESPPMASNIRHAQTVEGEDEGPLNPSQDDENTLLQYIEKAFGYNVTIHSRFP